MAIPSASKIAWLIRGGPAAQPLPVGGRPTTIASGRLGAWVGCSKAGPLMRVGLIAENRPRATGSTRCPVARVADPKDESICAVYPGGRVIHYGPDGGPGVTSASLGAQVSGTALGDHQAWAAAGKLVQIDPNTGAHRSFDVGPGAVSVVVDNGVWIATRQGT